MKKITRAASLSFALLLAGLSLSGGPALQMNGGNTENNALQTFSSDSGQALKSMALGPGLVNLSPADEFSTYQWGLKNDGEFRLMELKSKFQSVDNIFDSRNTGTGMPQPGPGDYESTVIHAVTGVDINIQPAWKLYDQAENKRSVIVAIIDTGIDINHLELKNAMWTNPGEVEGDGIDNDGNGYVDDVHGWNFYQGNSQVFNGSEDSHGTHAAGTIGAARGAYGIAGITDNNYVKIMSLKALGGADGVGSPEAVIQAIKYAEANGASICNLSMGTSSYSEALAQTIKDSTLLFVVSCGNGGVSGLGYDTDTYPVYPASLPYDNVISVANLLFDGSLSKDSNYGAASVDIAAPGSYILSTVPGNAYGFMSGTSMAAPMVTGVAAMLYSYRPDISLTDVKNIILNSSRKLDGLTGKTVSGGLLDAYGAMTWQ
ncbi:S8 family peptidase [Lachnospiraceae bacterium 54-53]